MADTQRIVTVRGRLILLLLLGCLVGTATGSAAAMTEQEFMAAYVPAAKQLQDAYGNLSMTVQVSRPEGSQQVRHVAKNGRFHTTSPDWVAAGEWDKHWHRRLENDEPEVRTVEEGSNNNFAWHAYLVAPFSFCGSPIVDEIRSGNWEFRSAAPCDEYAGKNVMRVEFYLKHWAPTYARGLVDFWIDDGKWSVLRIALVNPKAEYVAETAYEDDYVLDVPVPAVSFRGVYWKDGREKQEYLATFSDVVPTGDVHQKAFTAAGTHLLDVSPSPFYLTYWLAVALFVIVAAVVVITVWPRGRARVAALVLLAIITPAAAIALEPMSHLTGGTLVTVHDSGCKSNGCTITNQLRCTGGCTGTPTNPNAPNNTCDCEHPPNDDPTDPTCSCG